MADLYRKSSIEKLSNPEQLDKAITVTKPMSWIALIGVALIVVATIIWSILGTLPTTQTVSGAVVSNDSVSAFYSDYSGTVTEVLVTAGQDVDENDVLMVVKSSDGKEHKIKASEDGKITSVLTAVESSVYVGAEVVRYTPDCAADQVVVCYVPITMAKQLEVDMEVLLYPTSVDTQKYGHMKGKILTIGDYASATSNMWYVFGADNLVAEQFLASGPVVSVLCEIQTDDDTESGFYWSSDNGKDLTVSNGTFLSVKIVTDESAPITKLFNNLKEKLEGQ